MPKRYLGNIITDTPTEPTADAAGGVWSLAEVNTYKGSTLWPTIPDAPTIGTATAGAGSATVAFTAPELYGGTLSQYTATSTPGSITGTGTTSPITVSGLTNGTSYTFTVKATTGAGTGPDSAASNSATPEQPPYAVFFNVNGSNVIDYVTITTTGNASDWGDMPNTEKSTAAVGSGTRGVVTNYNAGNLYYITYASTGNSVEFGALTYGSASNAAAASNSTRGVYNTGNSSSSSNVLEYITIASTGDTTDFGDTINSNNYIGTNQGPSSPTRGLFGGGYFNGSSDVATIEYITFATTGNAASFGNVTQARFATTGASSNTRGLFAGGAGNGASSIYNIIDYVTIASTGNATDFGDLTQTCYHPAGTSDGTTAVFAGGYDGGYAASNVIGYVTIASTGNASDFGDLTVAKREFGATGPSHGGIS